MSKYYAKWKSGFYVIWRNLTKAEFDKINPVYQSSTFQEPMSVALEVYKKVCIDGPDADLVPSGIVAYICKQQMLNNPFGGKLEDISIAIEMARKAVSSNYLKYASALISSTFSYKPEEVENLDPNLFFIRLAQAELVTGQTVNPVDPSNPNTSNVKKAKRQLTESQQKALARTREERGKI